MDDFVYNVYFYPVRFNSSGNKIGDSSSKNKWIFTYQIGSEYIYDNHNRLCAKEWNQRNFHFMLWPELIQNGIYLLPNLIIVDKNKFKEDYPIWVNIEKTVYYSTFPEMGVDNTVLLTRESSGDISDSVTIDDLFTAYYRYGEAYTAYLHTA